MTELSPEWKKYRRRRTSFFVAWFGGFVFVALAAMICGFFDPPEAVMAPVLTAWVLSFFVTLGRLQWFRCPRCGEAFMPPFFGQPDKFLYSPRCFHCGLSAYGAPNT
jgi:hypothetical protein